MAKSNKSRNKASSKSSSKSGEAAASKSQVVALVRRQAAKTPEQRRFKRLIGQIDEARAVLAQWQLQIDAFRQNWFKVAIPLRDSLSAVARQSVFILDGLLSQSVWTRQEREHLRHIIRETAVELLVLGEDAQLQALHDKHGDTTFEEDKQALERFKKLAASVTGVDLGDGDLSNEDEVLAHMEEWLAERSEQHSHARRQRRPLGRAAVQREAEQQQATQSLREVYRKLVSVLHPDREPDSQLQAHKNELLQRVNRAYEAKDLLTLLEVQLEVEGVQTQQAASLGEQRLRHYNQILTEQLASLRTESESISMAFCAEFDLMWGRMEPHEIADFMTEQTRELEAELNRHKQELQKLTDVAWTKRWLKRERRRVKEAELWGDGSGGKRTSRGLAED